MKIHGKQHGTIVNAEKIINTPGEVVTEGTKPKSWTPPVDDKK